MVIVYRSDTGFTREYAQMLGKAEHIKVLPLEDALSRLERGTEALYLGPLMAGHITGVDKAVKRFDVKGVCAVGISPPQVVTDKTLRRANYVPNAPIFYLQGGWAPQRVGWLKRRMVNMVTKPMRATLQEKGSGRTPEEQAMLDMLLKGGSFVAFQNLDPVRNWLHTRA